MRSSTFEGTRSRVLLEQLAESRGQSAEQQPVLAALQRHLAKDDIVLSYAVLPRELLVWIVTRGRFEQHRVSVTAPELEELVNRFQRSLLDTSGQPDTVASHRLYRLLVDSASRLQPGANLIVIRTDGFTSFHSWRCRTRPADVFSFATMRSATRPAPRCCFKPRRPPLRFSHSSKVLAVGNPAFDRGHFNSPIFPRPRVRRADRLAV